MLWGPCGARQAQLQNPIQTNLRWEDLDFERKVITLQARKADPTRGIQEFQLKSRKTRTIPLKAALAEIIAPLRQEEGYLIQSKSGREVKRNRWNIPCQFGDWILGLISIGIMLAARFRA